MLIAKTIKQARKVIHEAKLKSKTIGFVPTMGALHKGHLSLVKKAKKDCDFVVVSIFVNPTQFGPKEDYRKYPRTFQNDKLLLEKENVDLVFCPSVKEMYPEDFSVYVTEENLSRFLCGKSRPGHFRGVCTVVAKLLNIITPDVAYFGQKDFQQAKIIEKMVKNLNLPLIVKLEPTIRENDGLAMSSRNKYLSGSERQDALAISQSLNLAKKLILKGERSCENIKNDIKKHICQKKSVKIDYVEIVDAETLEPGVKLSSRVVIAIAVYLGKTRLIDNIVLKV
ncbi:MAG: pantoate--beta-alanine ligase [Candidatus Omnitrophota bacterium]